MLPTVIVTERGAARLRTGHPWVFASEVMRPPDPGDGDGDVARVLDGSGRLLGTALYTAGAQLALRLLSREEVALDEPFLRGRLEQALARRAKLFGGADAFRVVHGEADLLPGLIVDRYADVVVLQSTARAIDAREPLIARLLAELTGARLVVARDDGSARDFEGLTRRKEVLLGAGPTTVVYHDAGSAFEVDVLLDGKTGGFLDQAENHARVSEYARGDGLDAFSYHGGFALALARGGCRSVLALDESAAAVERARNNADRNGLTQVTVEQANAFDRLRALEAEGRRFDVVVIDPPALAKRKSATSNPKSVERAYKELNLRGLRLTRPGGVLVTCSCSGKMTPEWFGEVLASAARDAGRVVQILERRGAGRDHPPLLGVPETDYLKAWFLRVLD
jgi:23S rRNA (cytosine1962-C5)-methyltransferase